MGSEMKQTTADACVVEMRHISKVFPGVKALEDVSFDLRPGEVHVETPQVKSKRDNRIFERSTQWKRDF